MAVIRPVSSKESSLALVGLLVGPLAPQVGIVPSAVTGWEGCRLRELEKLASGFCFRGSLWSRNGVEIKLVPVLAIFPSVPSRLLSVSAV